MSQSSNHAPAIVANEGVLHLSARDISVPASISPEAQEYLRLGGAFSRIEQPALEDKAGWREHIAVMDSQILPFLEMQTPPGKAEIRERMIGGVPVFDIVPENLTGDENSYLFDMHGGGLILCGGKGARQMALRTALRYRRRVIALDYRMAPDHPYPAALDDGLAVYRALLEEYNGHNMVFHGESGGGNLVAATLLRGRDEGLSLPAGVILNTPQLDLTESGDSFQTMSGIDMLGSLMQQNLLYADGEELSHPYLSPLFGDFTKGFPPTLLITGTRDLFLSNTVRMHLALRAADVEADLIVIEAGRHGNFPWGPEADQQDRQTRLFIERVLAAGKG